MTTYTIDRSYWGHGFAEDENPLFRQLPQNQKLQSILGQVATQHGFKNNDLNELITPVDLFQSMIDQEGNLPQNTPQSERDYFDLFVANEDQHTNFGNRVLRQADDTRLTTEEREAILIETFSENGHELVFIN